MSKSTRSVTSPPSILSRQGSSSVGTAPGGGDPRMQMALRQLNFGALPRPDAPGISLGDAGTGPAALEQASAIRHQTEVALARRDWIMAVMEWQRSLAAEPMVARRHTPTTEAFLRDFYAPGRPVLIDGAMAGWPALGRWTPDYLCGLIGSAMVEYQGGRNGRADFELAKDRHKSRSSFRDFIALIRSKAGNDAYITASNSAANREALAPLERDMGHLTDYLTAQHGMPWIGPEGTFTPLHFDLTNNLLAQVTGRKQVILIPPSETPHMYHRRHVFSDVHDLTDEARLKQYPRARHARRHEVVLEPGQLLYIPIGWWHQVRSLDFSVMLTYTNFRWPNAGHEGYPPG